MHRNVIFKHIADTPVAITLAGKRSAIMRIETRPIRVLDQSVHLLTFSVYKPIRMRNWLLLPVKTYI
jgi:hypothetical protein